jgi:hypothetical protein
VETKEFQDDHAAQTS